MKHFLPTLLFVLILPISLAACVAPIPVPPAPATVDETSSATKKTASRAAIPSGIYTASFAEDEIPSGLSSPPEVLRGEWEIHLSDAGQTIVAKDGETVVEGRYSSTDENVTLTDERGALACIGAQWESGTYQWQLVDDELILVNVNDECDGRTLLLTMRPWVKQE